MTTLNQNYMVSLEEAIQITALTPEVRFEWISQPGLGKTSSVKRLSEVTGITRYALIDAASMDIGDTGLPWVNHETKTSGFYPSERFELHSGEPVIIFIDELKKAPLPTQNALMPLQEEFRPRLGNVYLPEGSYVLSAGNFDTDGVGDNQLAHAINRKTTLYIRNHTADEWIMNYAIPNGLDGGLIAFVHDNPRIMASYRDPDQQDNPLIFQPTKVQGAFATGRSLSRASSILRNRGTVTHNALMAALAGTIGLAAAHELEAYVHYQASLPSRDSIINEPKNARLPDAGAACYVLVFNLVVLVDATNINPIITYVNRLPAEFQSVFFLQVAKNKDKQKIAFRNDLFKQWLLANEDLL
jgi:hypothetical protein